MGNSIRRRLAALVVLAGFVLPAQAQEDNPFLKRPERGPPVGEYAVAAITTMAIMVAVCMPSRKR